MHLYSRLCVQKHHKRGQARHKRQQKQKSTNLPKICAPRFHAERTGCCVESSHRESISSKSVVQKKHRFSSSTLTLGGRVFETVASKDSIWTVASKIPSSVCQGVVRSRLKRVFKAASVEASSELTIERTGTEQVILMVTGQPPPLK